MGTSTIYTIYTIYHWIQTIIINRVAFSIELQEWGHTLSGNFGKGEGVRDSKMERSFTLGTYMTNLRFNQKFKKLLSFYAYKG